MSLQSQTTLSSPVTADRVVVTPAVSYHPDATVAVAELRERLGDTADLVAVFVSPGYDLDAAGAAIGDWCDGRVIGCTSSGNIGPGGYEDSSICAVALAGGGIRTRTLTIESLTDVPDAVERAGPELADLHACRDRSEGFAILLVDGLSMREDRLAAELMAALGDVPIIGGSAGDALTFTRTAVYHHGRFVSDTATLTMVALDAPFGLFRFHHHEPTDRVLIATEASPDQRRIHSFNGRPAAAAYAEAVGVGVDRLGPQAFSAHPLVLRAAGGTWVRSIKEANADGSLGLFASVEVGEVLRIGRSTGMVERLAGQFASLSQEVEGISGVLAFDCVLRRLEFEEHALSGEVGRILAHHRAAGCSTYGEQFNGMHMNQTLVGVAFGGRDR